MKTGVEGIASGRVRRVEGRSWSSCRPDEVVRRGSRGEGSYELSLPWVVDWVKRKLLGCNMVTGMTAWGWW
jgi:hypothetical protein